MDWRLSLGFWEAGLKMAELILFTIHRKIRPYIPWEKIKEELEPIITVFVHSLLLAIVLLQCCQTMPENYKGPEPSGWMFAT